MPLPRRGRLEWVLCLIAMVAGCAAPQPAVQAGSCPATQGTPMLAFELFFGRSVQGQNEVTDRDWEGFLDKTVTPSLPNCYTVFDATGAWLNPATGLTIHERTKVLLAALTDAAANAAAIARIRQAYAAQFHQTSVGMTVTPACGAF